MAAITILYAFIYLLHLANEKGSEIEGMEGQEDFIERSDVARSSLFSERTE